MNRSKGALFNEEVKAEDKAEKKANLKQEALPKLEGQHQSKAEQKSEVKPKEDTGANTEAFSELQAQVQWDNKAEVKENAQGEEKAESDDPALKFIAKAQKGRKKQRMEDIMVKRTHWYNKEDLRKIDQLSRMTGESKYQVISTAINSLYLRVMETKKKRP